MKPTSIGDASGQHGDKESSKQHPASPTKISSGNPKPTAMPASAPVMPCVMAPSSIPGAIRKRIPADRTELKRRNRASDNVIDKAIHIVESVNQDTLALTDVMLWGQSLQAEHQALVSETLVIAQSETIVIVTGHLHRLMTILEQIELEKIFGGHRNVFAKIIGKATGKIDTPDELDEALRELTQLSTLLQGRIDELLTLRMLMETNARKIESIGNDIESSLMAAEIIVEFFRTISRLDFVARLEERMASLTVTLGHIRSGGLMRELHIEQPMNLTTLVQETVFNTLVSWMTSVIALRMTLHGHQNPNPTEVREISRIKQNIEKKLRNQ